MSNDDEYIAIVARGLGEPPEVIRRDDLGAVVRSPVRPLPPPASLTKDGADAKLGNYIVSRARGVEDLLGYREGIALTFEHGGFPDHAFIVRQIDRLCSLLSYSAVVGRSPKR